MGKIRPPEAAVWAAPGAVPADSTLEADRRRFFNVLETLPAYLILLAPNYTVPFENKFFRERFGESLGRRCYEYLFRRDEPCENCETYKVLKTNAPHHWEWMGPDGRIYDIHDFPFTDSDGSPLIMEMGVDITERKQTERTLAAANAELEGRVGQRTADLAASEQRWATTLASIGDAVIAADTEGRITFINPTAEALTGWTFREAAGRPARDVFRIINENTRRPSDDPIAKVLASGAITGLANYTLLVRRDGTEIAVDDSGAPIQGPDGKTAGAVLVFRDITQRRTSEKLIQDLARFPDENPNPVLRIDREGTVLYANRASRVLENSRLATVGGKIPPDWFALAEQAFAAQEKVAADIAVDGKTLLLTIAPIAEEGYANLYTIDITERRRKETELARLNRTLKAISESNQAMMRARDESGFMSEACRIIVENSGHAMMWIGMAEQDEGKTVRTAAHFGFEDGYLETLRLTWEDSERGRGPTGTAIRTGKITQCRNMQTDPAFMPWRAEALKRGYASSIALPLLAEEQPFGAVTIYSREPDPFSDEEVALLAGLAGDLSYGIQAIRTRVMRDNLLTQVEEQRWVAQQLADEQGAVFASLAEAVLVYDSGGRIRRANAAALQLLGFNPAHLSTAEIAARLSTRTADGRRLDPALSPTARALAGTPVSDERYRISGAGGRELTVMSSASPLFEGGRISGAVTVLHDVTEEDRLVSETQRRAAELDAIINSIADGIMIHDPQGNLLRMNPTAERMMGYTAEDKSLPFREWVTRVIRVELPDGSPIADPQDMPISHALRGETVQGKVLGLRQLRTGKIFWVSVNAEPLRTADGAIFRIVSTLIDITDRMEREVELETQVKARTRELEEAGAYTRSLIEATIDPMVTITPEGKIGDVNAATEAVTGCSRAELIGKDFSDYFTDGDKARAGYRRVFDEGKVSDYELEIRRRDGRITPVLYNASVYTDESGAVKGVIAAARDITRRRQGEVKIRESIRRIETVAEISHLLAEAGPNYAPVLPMVAERAASLADGTCRIHLPGEKGELALAAQYGNAPADQPENLVDGVFQAREILFLPADGSVETKPAGAAVGMILPLLFQDTVLGTLTVTRTAPGLVFESDEITSIRTVADRIALAITNSHLYTDLKNALAEEQKARQQLVRAEKLAAMGRLLGSVAHELNNPLQTIKNCLYLVQQEAPSSSSIQNFIGMASSETERLVHLVAELRELYRPRPDHTPSLCDLVDILHEVRSLMEQPMYEGKVRWEQAAGAKGCIVRGEKERIQQVFINLATNAIEAMQPEGGTLAVDLIQSADGREAGVVFRDTGPGIPPELIPNLFEPFVTTKSSGLGLGLSICYEIAQKHGGRLSVENSADGGAVFTFWIPLPKGEKTEKQPPGK